ncbi:MAG: glutamate synthase subunit beta, partial [Nitrospirales bacterium]
MGDPRGFVKFSREGPTRRPVELRVLDWNEMYEPFSEDKLRNQGGRCMDCGVPFCQSNNGCPVVNLIPEWNDLVHRGRWKDALKALHSTNNFPEFTGRLCPAPCESACVLGINADPVSIRVVEWNIIDRGFDEGWIDPVMPVVKTGKKVAVVGSGPAGLAADQQLARAGHSVMVYEKADRIGGLLRYGIPDFKMEKWVIDRRLDQMKAEGVQFETSVNVGEDVTGEDLARQFDAICLALGAEQPRDLPVPGRELNG